MTVYTYPYPRPALTVDIVLLKVGDSGVEVLLIQRKHPPFEECWALPGGFVDQDESPEVAARRELLEETNLETVGLQQLGAFGDPGRDPRGWTVSIAFWGWLDAQGALRARAGDDAANVAWWPLNALPPLAFDHAKILALAERATPNLKI